MLVKGNTGIILANNQEKLRIVDRIYNCLKFEELIKKTNRENLLDTL